MERLRRAGVVIVIATTVVGAAELEHHVRFEQYYQHLGEQPEHLSCLQRLFFTVLFAAKDHMGKEKGRLESLPFSTASSKAA